MQVFHFKSDKDATLHGFALDKSGASLPSDLGPWAPLYGAGDPVGDETLQPEGAERLRRDGFWVYRPDIIVRHGGSLPSAV